MASVTKTHVIRIGNSQGVRIPKVILEQLGLSEEVEMAIVNDQLVIRSAKRPRQDWNRLFKDMHKNGDDKIADEFPASTWDDQEWEWK